MQAGIFGCSHSYLMQAGIFQNQQYWTKTGIFKIDNLMQAGIFQNLKHLTQEGIF